MLSNVIRRRFCVPNQFLSLLLSTSVETLDYSSDSPSFESNPQIRVRRQMQESAKLGNLDEALAALNLLKPSILDYNGMLHCYFKSGSVSVERAAEIFQGMKRHGPCPNVWTFNIVFNGLCSLGLLQAAFFVVEDMCCHGFVPSFASLMKLMKRSLNSGTFDICLQVLELMLRFGYKPGWVVVNSLIAELCKGKSVYEAYHVFSISLEMGLVPNVYACNSLLFGLCRSWCWSALCLFYSFRKRGFVPNAYSYTSLVMGFGNRGLWKQVLQIFDEMRMDGCLPTVVTYTVLIKSLCRYGLVNEGLRILKVMSEEGCDPDLVTYNVLLGALSAANRVSDAGQLIWIMEEKGLIPDQYTCCAVAAGLMKNGYVRESQNLLYRVVRSNVMDIVAWNVFLHSLCVDNRAWEAVAMLSCMMKRGFVPNSVTCNIILKGLCMECVEEALCFFDQFVWGKNEPDLIAFSTILSAACKQGNSSIIWKVLERMDSVGVKPSVVSMTYLIQYFGKAGRSKEWAKLFNYMIHHGYSLTTITCNVLLNNLCKKGLLEDAKKLFNKLKDIGTFPDTTSYNILIHAYIRNGDFLIVQCLLYDLYSQGLVPDAITHGSLIHSLCKEKSVDGALGLQERMVEDGGGLSISYFNPILAAMFRKDRLWDAFLILVKMEIEGRESNAVCCQTFDHAMSTGGRKRFSRARKVLEILIENAYIRSRVDSV